MKKFAYTLLIITSGVLTGCLNTDEPAFNNTPVALVALYHASPDGGNLKIALDEEALSTAAFKFKDYTGYLNFRAGVRALSFLSFTDSDSLTGVTYDFKENKYYSVYLINRRSDIEPLILEDEALSNPNNNAVIRFINLSPDAPALDLKIAGKAETLFTAQSFKSSTPFTTVAAEPATNFELTYSGDDSVLTSSSNLRLEANQYYTIIAQGFVDPPTAEDPALSLAVLKN